MKEKPVKAHMVKKSLRDFCGKYTLPYHAVITLVHEDSTTHEIYYHAARVSNASFVLKFSSFEAYIDYLAPTIKSL